MAHVQELIPSVCIIRILIGLACFVITGSVLHSEIRKRRLSTTLFSSGLLRFTSAGCLWCGPISSLFLIFSVIPGFCMIRLIGTMIPLYTQTTLLGFYQLSRLYYCFSNQQLHGKRGYPICLFLVMAIIGIILWISDLIVHVFVRTMPRKCGYRNDLSFFCQFREKSILFDGSTWEGYSLHSIWSIANGLSVLMWDLTTLLLYSYKIWQIGAVYKSKQDGVWNNVLFILHRVVIITVFYQVFEFGVFLAWRLPSLPLLVSNKMVLNLIGAGVQGFWIMVFSFCMFMMMDHNTKAYFHFLHFLRRFRLKYLFFCCYHKMVDQQIEHLEPLQGLELRTIPTGPRAEIESTWFPDLSSHIGADSNKLQRETGRMSLNTVTVVDPYYVLMQE